MLLTPIRRRDRANQRRILASVAAVALEEAALTTSAFEAAQQEGKPIVVHVSATWCETCHAQKAVFEKLEEEENFRAFSFYTVDFDTQKDVMHTFYAPSRSTIIAFKLATKSDAGGDTSEEAIRALIEKCI